MGRPAVPAVLLFSLLLANVIGAQTTPHTSEVPSVPGKFFDYAVTILMENAGINDTNAYVNNNVCPPLGGCYVLGNPSLPFMNSFYLTHAVAEGYTAISHPSEPNYCGLTSGNYSSTCVNVCCFTENATNIVDGLESVGLTWQAYAEKSSNSGLCSFMPDDASHFPLLFYQDMNTPARCANFLATTAPTDPEFLAALNSTTTANFYWLTPSGNDSCHDMGTTSYCDSYLKNLVTSILNTQLFTTRRAVLFITFDEGGGKYPNDYVYTVLAGPQVKTGYVSTVQYSHYSWLKTIEDNWNLPCLANDCTALSMTEFFTNSTAGSNTPALGGGPPLPF